ncbi:MAG TPA: hypothetical protein VEL76_42500 [Gemmataceae bacterium]|nr:hypothetical protein [Gemmataceae bacterium]
MNTVGKILVVLNLLFGLATGAMIVYWKANDARHAEALAQNERVFKDAVANARAYQDTAKGLIAENNRLRVDLEQQKLNSGAKESEQSAESKRWEKQFLDQKVAAEKAILVKEQALQEAKRLQGEVQLLNDVVAKREQAILALQVDIKRYINEAQFQRTTADAARERSRQLLIQLQEKELLLTKLQQGTKESLASLPVTSPNYRNPPAAFVKGRILKIDSTDRTLVTVSVGSDVGVNKDNTLEVYRLRPQPEYLGRLRIREARSNEAVGTFTQALTSRSPLLEGDVVATDMSR